VLAAKAATATIPILFLIGYDPVQFGLVGSPNRPGSNVTAPIFFTGALGSKRLDLALQLAPNSVKIGLLVNPNSPTSQTQARDMQDAAVVLGVRRMCSKPKVRPKWKQHFKTSSNWE